jgi:hypothetical protein
MAKVITDSLFFCTDCTQAAANDDYTGLSYYLREEDATKRMQEIKTALNDLGGYPVPNDEELEFSWRHCDCCKSTLGGSRTGFSLLGD